jgi:hypothetical protein
MSKASKIAPRGFLRHYLNYDWLVVLALSWLAPMLCFNLWDRTYLHSESFWILPIAALLPRFFYEEPPGSKRRKAFYWATVFILVGGSALDLLFGKDILTFEGGNYFGFFCGIPLEEFIFYLLGPVAMLLVYFWCDSYFLKADSPANLRLKLGMEQYLVQASPALLAWAVGLLLLGFGLKQLWAPGTGIWPEYFLFLLAAAFLPTIFFYRVVKNLVNWQAMTLTVFYVLVTSIIWEPTLGVPLKWWGYQPKAMVGLYLRAWQDSMKVNLPIEAVLLWLTVPFACVFFFEIVSAHHTHTAKKWQDRYFSRKLGWRASFRIFPKTKP